MGTDEISRQVVAGAVVQELLHPGIRGGGRPADPERRVHGLDRQKRVTKQLEIVVPRPGPERGQVGLVPDFEKPLTHLLDAVPVDPMAHQLADQRRPLIVVPRRRDVASIVEDGVVAGCERFRHEAQLDERPHADRQQKVPDPIGVEERIEQLVLMADERPHVIVQQAVEAHVAEAQLLVAPAQLILPVRPERQEGVAAPDRVLPGMGERGRGGGQIAAEGHSHVTHRFDCRSGYTIPDSWVSKQVDRPPEKRRQVGSGSLRGVRPPAPARRLAHRSHPL